MKMERNKLEKELRRKMNQREIAPSSQAWDRLDAMLSVAEQQKRKPKTNWLFIAASFVGFLLVGTVFFSNIETATDQPINEVVIQNQTPSVEPATTPLLPQAPQTAIASVQPSESIANPINQKSSINPMRQARPISDPRLVASNHPQQPGNLEKGNAINQDMGHEALANPKADLPTTRANVDELLAQVAQAGVQPKTSVKVSAQSLLSTVDEGSALSFREKMMRRASEVAAVVSARNIEQ